MDLTNMREEEKNIFCLLVADNASSYLENPEIKALIEKAIKRAWEWVDKQSDVSEELYDYLDNEENGFTVFQESEKDKRMIAAWNCIIDAIAFVCKSAYLVKGAQFFPEPIELVDDDTIEHMIDSYLFCSGGDEKKLNIIYERATIGHIDNG